MFEIECAMARIPKPLLFDDTDFEPREFEDYKVAVTNGFQNCTVKT
jgi:hypothetical protein